jgi:hypothetical protein
MAAIVHMPFKVIAFNVNDIARQRYGLGKQLEELLIDLALFSETHFKPHERVLLQIITFIRPTATRTEKVELPLQLGKAFPTII